MGRRACKGENIFDVACKRLLPALNSTAQALFRAKPAHSGATEDFRDGRREGRPVRDLVFMVFEPEAGDISDVKVDVRELGAVVPFVTRAHSFVLDDPILDVLVVGAAKYRWVSVSGHASTEDCRWYGSSLRWARISHGKSGW